MDVVMNRIIGQLILLLKFAVSVVTTGRASRVVCIYIILCWNVPCLYNERERERLNVHVKKYVVMIITTIYGTRRRSA